MIDRWRGLDALDAATAGEVSLGCVVGHVVVSNGRTASGLTIDATATTVESGSGVVPNDVVSKVAE